MTKRLCHIGMTLALAVILGSHAWAASKEEIQLQVQLQNLLDQLTRIQKSMNEGVGLMNDLATRNADTVKKLQSTLDQLRDQLGHQETANDKQVEKISSQLNTLSTALTEMKGQVDKALQPPATNTSAGAGQTPPAQAVAPTPVVPAAPLPPTTTPAANSPSSAPVSAPAPDARTASPITTPAANNSQPPAVSKQEIYESAMESYRSKDYEAAALQFTKYLKVDRQSETAVNAQFYLAQIEFDQSDFEGALEDFTSVGPRLTDNAKAATAQYKKALCLIQVERRDEAIPELKEVVQKYPGSPEARLAAKKLRALRAAH